MKNLDVRIFIPKKQNDLWYVYIYHNNKILKKFYKGINKGIDYSEKLNLAQTLQTVIIEKLKKGYLSGSVNELPKPFDNSYSILQSYDIAFKIIQNSERKKKTLTEYKRHYDLFKKTLIKLQFQNFDIREFEAYQLNIILEECSKECQTNNFFNTQKKICSIFFSILVREYIIKNNPIS